MAIATPNRRNGYDYDLIDTPPDRLVCKICHLPSRDPYLSVCCGHVFCKSCLDNVKKAAAITNACPVCRDEEFVTFPNKQADREIRSLHIYCTNKERGCKWQGELNDIKNHLGNSDGCQFEVVKCSNKCGKMIQRQYLTSHVETECPCRKVDCQYCHDTGEHQFIEGQHKEECPKLPLSCPNKCEVESVPREDMEAHRKECPLEDIYCPNDCREKLKRQCLVQHLNTECPRREVNCQYCHDAGEHQFIEGQHKKECPKLPLPCPNKCEVGSVLREDMEAHRKECPLEMIQCEYYSVGCEVRMARKDLEKHNDEKVKEHLMMTKHGLSKLVDIQHELMDTKIQLAASLQQTANLTAVLMNAQLGPNTAANRINIRSVCLNSMAAMLKCGNQECPVTIKMTDYSIKKRDEGLWFSDPFYTHNKGYKMCLNVISAGHKDGKGKGTHLSVFLYLMKGPHDDELTWPLRGEFEVKLLNQISDNEHRTGTVTYNDNIVSKDSSGRVVEGNRSIYGRGRHQYISNQDLNKYTLSCQYLKDDCLFFQVNLKAY